MKISILLYAKLDWPKPPFKAPDIRLENTEYSLRDDARTAAAEQGYRFTSHSRDDAYYNRELHHPDGNSPNTVNYPCISDPGTVWAKKNFGSSITDMRYAFTLPGRRRTGPHVDVSRRYAAIYLLSSGGHDHRTMFWQEKTHASLEREAGAWVDDYALLEQVASLELSLNTWTLLNTGILHSVENIIAGRSSWQIGMKELALDLKLIDPVYV